MRKGHLLAASFDSGRTEGTAQPTVGRARITTGNVRATLDTVPNLDAVGWREPKRALPLKHCDRLSMFQRVL